MLAMLSLVATTFADIPHRHSLIRRIVKSHNAPYRERSLRIHNG